MGKWNRARGDAVMSLRTPATRDQVYDKLSADVKANLPNSNPQKEQSWLKAILVGFAGAFFDCYLQILEAINTFFADTTYGEYLERRAAEQGVTRNPATQATGSVVLTGTATTLIPTLTSMSINSRTYKTQGSQTIVTSSLNLASLTYAAGIATAITTSEHNLANGMSVIIAGATPSGLNGTVVVKAVTGKFSFTYETAIGGSGTATGSITVTATKAIVTILSDDVGAIQNLNANELLVLTSPIVGVDNTARVTYGGVGGGADQEDDDSLRERLIYRLQNPVTLFNKAQITLEAKQFAFVKRVFVFEITPEVGAVTVYILKDNNVLPDSSELSQVKQRIIDTILPANTDPADLYVLAPTPHTINFQISALLPNTATMKASITNRLTEYFRRKTVVGQDVFTEDWITEIKSTIDTETGETVIDFTMDAPVADVVIANNEIAVLGTVVFA